jgi:hypothetical protein
MPFGNSGSRSDHYRLVERMTHVQRAGHVGRRQLDAERRLAGIGGRGVVLPLLPFGAPAFFMSAGSKDLANSMIWCVFAEPRIIRDGCRCRPFAYQDGGAILRRKGLSGYAFAA